MAMEEQEAKTIRTLIYGGVLLIFGFIASCQATNYQIRAAVDSGASPLAANCAFNSSAGQYCDVLAAAEAEASRSK